MIEIHSQITCPPSGNKCAAQITTDGKKCLTPCEGVYADVTKLEAKNISGDHFESLLRNYNNYKRFFDISKSKFVNSLLFLLLIINRNANSSKVEVCKHFL